jgi:phosphoribosylamine---glycine ligase
MKLLLLGSGGREHVIADSLIKSEKLTKLYVLPGNPGIAEIAELVSDIKLEELHKIKNFCLDKKIDLVVVGPEQPLADGVTDYLGSYDIKVMGCNSFASQLESSKSFTKKICDEKNIPTAAYRVFTDSEVALPYIEKMDKYPVVIKADGLAAGKGVIISKNYEDAKKAVLDIFAGKYGAMNKIVVEEFLEGVEASFFAISDGKDFKILSSAGDHKRLLDNDKGPNTGGMGTYSPSPFVTKEVQSQVIEDILKPTLEYMQEKDRPYKGFIFVGLMINDDKPFLIEYNVRFGDPEAQSIFPRLETDLLDICNAVIDENLVDLDIRFSKKKAITLVMAAKGYPEKYQKDTVIDLQKVDRNKVKVFHAGTAIKNESLVANGGRVLNITAMADSFQRAQDVIYEQAKLVNWKDKYYRKDIASKAIKS